MTDLDQARDLRGLSTTRKRRFLAVGSVFLCLTAAVGGRLYFNTPHASRTLYSAMVAIGVNGERVNVPPGKPNVPLFPGSRVLSSTGPVGKLLADDQIEWLNSGTIPNPSDDYRDMVTTALLDINTLLLPNGAALAGSPTSWRYVWPRDASVVAVALSHTGHTLDALKVMKFLQSQLPPDGLFQARYRPDGSGPPDGRGIQTDGTGWVLWAASQLVNDLPAGARKAETLAELKPLIDRATAAALKLTNGPGALPKPSLDYWEVHDSRLSLGTAAPLNFGLEAAVGLQQALGNPQLARAAQDRATTLRASIDKRFGRHGYPRYLGDDKPDASIAFLLPPFTKDADPAVVKVWRKAARGMLRPAGGLAPGVGWKDPGTSWTPQTALFALTAASIGDRATADHWLTWLTKHRTQYGALPEKVLSNGHPAGPAPLAWTDAFVLLAADSLTRSAQPAP